MITRKKDLVGKVTRTFVTTSVDIAKVDNGEVTQVGNVQLEGKLLEEVAALKGMKQFKKNNNVSGVGYFVSGIHYQQDTYAMPVEQFKDMAELVDLDMEGEEPVNE